MVKARGFQPLVHDRIRTQGLKAPGYSSAEQTRQSGASEDCCGWASSPRVPGAWKPPEENGRRRSRVRQNAGKPRGRHQPAFWTNAATPTRPKAPGYLPSPRLGRRSSTTSELVCRARMTTHTLPSCHIHPGSRTAGAIGCSRLSLGAGCLGKTRPSHTRLEVA